MDAAARLADDNSQERAYRYLKDAILNLEFRANAPMRAQSIAESLKVSRTPVREALSRLEQEGLVARADGWGYVVKPMSLKEALDIYKVREALEVEAVREAIPNMDGARLERMRACLRRAGEEMRKERFNRFRDNTREFYHLIAEASGNACLQAMLMTIDDRIRLLGALMANKHLGRPNESLAENLAVLKAIESADQAGAEEAVRKHVSKARETLLRHVMDKPDRILI